RSGAPRTVSARRPPSQPRDKPPASRRPQPAPPHRSGLAPRDRPRSRRRPSGGGQRPGRRAAAGAREGVGAKHGLRQPEGLHRSDPLGLVETGSIDLSNGRARHHRPRRQPVEGGTGAVVSQDNVSRNTCLTRRNRGLWRASLAAAGGSLRLGEGAPLEAHLARVGDGKGVSARRESPPLAPTRGDPQFPCFGERPSSAHPSAGTPSCGSWFVASYPQQKRTARRAPLIWKRIGAGRTILPEAGPHA